MSLALRLADRTLNHIHRQPVGVWPEATFCWLLVWHAAHRR